MKENIHHNLELIEKVALQKAEQHNRIYHIILMNPDENGTFDAEKGSTYEIVTDDFLNDDETESSVNYISICDTNDIKNRKP